MLRESILRDNLVPALVVEARKVLDKALTLLSEGSPSFVCRALSDISLGVQDFTCQPPYMKKKYMLVLIFRLLRFYFVEIMESEYIFI